MRRKFSGMFLDSAPGGRDGSRGPRGSRQLPPDLLMSQLGLGLYSLHPSLRGAGRPRTGLASGWVALFSEGNAITFPAGGG